VTTRRSLFAIGCVSLALIVLGVVHFSKSNGLSYKGTSIDEWLACFDSPSGLSQGQWQELIRKRDDAGYALRQMGPDVLPHLRRMLQPDGGTARSLRKLTGELTRKHVAEGEAVPPSVEETRMLRAVEACAALGPQAGAMAPDLIQVLKGNPYSNCRSRAAIALGRIGGAPQTVVPALAQSLDNHTDGNVLISLGRYGAEARIAVPSIVALLDGFERKVREHESLDKNILCEAARALCLIDRPEAERRLPFLRQILEEEIDPFWRSRLTKVIDLIVSADSPKADEG
jgi:hypothetical protein